MATTSLETCLLLGTTGCHAGFHSGGQDVLKVMGKIKQRVLEETVMAGRGTSSHIHKSTGMNIHKSQQPSSEGNLGFIVRPGLA